jgi:hypothetical protein
MNASETSIEEICMIAKAFLSATTELRSTLEVVQASLVHTIEQCSVSKKEKDALIHVIQKVSPAGLNSLLESIEITERRTRSLYTKGYEELARTLAQSILEQKGVAGPTGERTFNSKADGDRAAALEVPQNSPAPKAVVTKVQTTKGTSTYSKYTELRQQYPVLRQLDKKASSSPIHQWVKQCGYDMTDSKKASASLDKGMAALLWPVGSRTNAVSAVQALAHPCGKGTVYILQMEKPTTKELGSHLSIEHHAVWLPSKYPNHAIVEVSNDPEQLSRDCPFSRKRRGWEAIYAELALVAQLNNHDESTRPSNQPSSISSIKQQPKATHPQPAVAAR